VHYQKPQCRLGWIVKVSSFHSSLLQTQQDEDDEYDGPLQIGSSYSLPIFSCADYQAASQCNLEDANYSGKRTETETDSVSPSPAPHGPMAKEDN